MVNKKYRSVRNCLKVAQKRAWENAQMQRWAKERGDEISFTNFSNP